MNWFAIVSVCATIVSLLLGIVVYSFNRKAILNRLFFLTSIAAFAYEFTTVMMWMSSNVDTAYFWHKMGTVWPFFVAIVLNFALVFTKNKWIKKRLNYLVLYLPAITFWLIDLFTYQINGAPVLKYWGYNDVATGTVVYYLSTIWTAVLPIIAFVLCYRYYQAETDSTKKLQEKQVAVGFAIPIVTFIVTNMLTRSLGIDFPNLGISATLFFSVFVGYAIVKYELFSLDASVVSEQIITSIPDSFVLADENGKIVRINDRLVNFLGYSEKELISDSMTKLFAMEDKGALDIIIRQLIRDDVLRNFEVKLSTKSGETRNVLFSGSMVRSKRGKPIGITCVINDITGRIEMEQRVLKSERLASIGELAGQIGHDLRNPLAGIKNAVFFIKKKNGLMQAAEVLEVCGWIESAVADSDRIISSLVDYSSDLHLEVGYCTPKSLTMGAISKVSVPERININNLSTDSVDLLLDSEKIEASFARVIQNAIEAMLERGSITISNEIKGPNIEISFKDTGTGISEKILPLMFAPLSTTKAKGMGMSLAICKRIVEAHGGTIAFESSKDQGSIFTFVLPITMEIFEQKELKGVPCGTC
jgi:PAS domain S-box-containing protein